MRNMASYNVVLKGPDRRFSAELKPQVERVLAKLAPLVASSLKAKRQADFTELVRALLRGVEMRSVDVERAQLQANALRAVLENAIWLSAEDIGRAGGFSASNLAAPAHRWKQEGKIFSILHDGQERFATYALDETHRPLPALTAVLEPLGPISGWRIALWFESSNAWLAGERPRERLANKPADVIEAARHYADLAHA